MGSEENKGGLTPGTILASLVRFSRPSVYDILPTVGVLSMSKIVPTPPPGFDDLSVDEQIDFVQSLWDRIAATAEQVPVPEWHR